MLNWPGSGTEWMVDGGDLARLQESPRFENYLRIKSTAYLSIDSQYWVIINLISIDEMKWQLRLVNSLKLTVEVSILGSPNQFSAN